MFKKGIEFEVVGKAKFFQAQAAFTHRFPVLIEQPFGPRLTQRKIAAKGNDLNQTTVGSMPSQKFIRTEPFGFV